MPTNRKLRGEIVNSDSPNRGPVNALLGPDLAASFTWMHEVELGNRTRIHAYRHNLAYRTLLVTRDGRCYDEETEGAYRQISQHAAIQTVYCLGSRSPDRYEPVNALTPRQRAVLSFIRDHASNDLLEPGEETMLLAGPGPGELFAPRWDGPDRFDDLHWRGAGWRMNLPDDEATPEGVTADPSGADDWDTIPF